MADHTERTDQRESCEIPIQWTDYHSGDYRDAIIQNRSKGGLYLKAQSCTHAKSDIIIKPLTDVPCQEQNDSEPFRLYEAKVKWTEKLPTDSGLFFGIGVQYTSKSHKIYEPRYQCSMCDNYILFGDIHELEEFVYLCSGCMEKYQNMPDGVIKNNLKNFMIGNII